eukprot:m.19225 g.19225  ORF g.19225 m.19225 type:complete len:191 (-) comp7998_c0_seq2:1995-2567(-)
MQALKTRARRVCLFPSLHCPVGNLLVRMYCGIVQLSRAMVQNPSASTNDLRRRVMQRAKDVEAAFQKYDTLLKTHTPPVSAISEGETQADTQLQVQERQFAAQVDQRRRFLEQRDRQIQELEQSMKDVFELFQQVHDMVKTQGQQLDDVDTVVKRAYAKTEAGVNDLKSANDTHKEQAPLATWLLSWFNL